MVKKRKSVPKMYFKDNMSVRDIAKELKIPDMSVRDRIRKSKTSKKWKGLSD